MIKETQKIQKKNGETEKTFVLVPGAWHGGWAYDSITETLTKLGKTCYSITLPGLESEPVSYNEVINLDMHIRFVKDFLIINNLQNVILCGHSYAGLVITGVADELYKRIHTLVYIDAYIPKNGDSCWSLTTDIYRQRFIDGARDNGLMVKDRPGVDARRRPHPMATLLQSLKISGNNEQVPNRTFIYLSGWENSPFVTQYEFLRHSPAWNIETIDCGHNVMSERPGELADILYKIGGKI